MSGARINARELSPDQRRQMGIRLPRAPRAFTKEHVRRYALRVLAEVAQLSQEQRRRVLEHARKVNDV